MSNQEPTHSILHDLVQKHSASKGDDTQDLAERAHALMSIGYGLLVHLSTVRGVPADQINNIIAEAMEAAGGMDLMRCAGCECTALSPCMVDGHPCEWSWAYMCTRCSRDGLRGLLVDAGVEIPEGRRKDGPMPEPGLGVIECDHPEIVTRIVSELMQCKLHMLDPESAFPHLSAVVLPDDAGQAARALRSMNAARDRLSSAGALVILSVTQDRIAEVRAHASELFSRSPFFRRLRAFKVGR